MPAFVETLQSAANRADHAEAELNKEIVQRRKAIEEDRKFAYRRVNFMKAIAGAVAGAETADAAVAQAQAEMRDRLGWAADSEARQVALTDFVPVAKAIFADMAPAETEPPDADVLGELAAFESRYLQRQGKSFWVLFENYMPETPLVDF